MLTNGALIVGSGRTPIRDLSARIVLNPEQLGVTEVHATSDGVQVTEATAVVSDLRDSPAIDLTAAGNADAKSLIRLLSAVWPSAGVSESLSGVEEVDGNLDLWIHAAGPLKDGGIQLINVRVEAQELAFRASPLPLPVRQLSGQVDILPGRVEIEKLRWRLGAVPVEASGRIDLAKTARFDDVELLVDMGARELAAQLAGDRDGPFQTESSGSIHLRTTLSGPLTAPQIVGLLDRQARDEVVTWVLESAEAPLTALLGDLVRATPDPVCPPACTVLAWVAHAFGNGALANVAVDRALRHDPDYTMARLVREGLDRQVRPSAVRQVSAEVRSDIDQRCRRPGA